MGFVRERAQVATISAKVIHDYGRQVIEEASQRARSALGAKIAEELSLRDGGAFVTISRSDANHAGNRLTPNDPPRVEVTWRARMEWPEL